MTQSVTTGTENQAGARRRLLLASGLVVLAAVIGTAVFPAGHGSRAPVRDRDPNAKTLVGVLSQTIKTQGIATAAQQYRDLQERGFPGLHESEADTKALGYRLLRKGDHESAIQVFRLNASAHPGSANVYDSLGEAYLAAGHKTLAIESYERAVAINPRLKSAAGELQRLTNRPRAAYPPIVLFHVLAGTLGILSGALAAALRKGSRRHGLAGSVFVVSMLCMSASGAYRAFVDPDGDPVNVVMGALTFYLVATAWWTARRRTCATGPMDWVALLVVVAISTGLVRVGFTTRSLAVVCFAFGAVAVLAAVSDFRMVVRGGMPDNRRIARHLWRMCTSLFIAVQSLFLGQPQVFPPVVRKSGLLFVPGLLVIILLVYWMVRVRRAGGYSRTASLKPKAVVGQTVGRREQVAPLA